MRAVLPVCGPLMRMAVVAGFGLLTACGADSLVGPPTLEGVDAEGTNDGQLQGDGGTTDAESGSDAGAATDAVTGSDAEAGTDAVTGSDAEAGTDAATGSDGEAGTDAVTGSDAEAGTDAATGSDAEAGTDAATGADGEAGTDAATGWDAEAGTDAGSGSDVISVPCGGVDCNDGNPCTIDSCDPTDGCTWTPTTAPCDDSNPCTTGDSCGVVPGKGPTCVAGSTATNCDDGNTCTQDGCDAASGCTHAPTASGSTCDDGTVCTSGDTCQNGACTGSGASACDDGNPCTTDKCDAKTAACSYTAAAAACDDGDACTTADACSAGKCVGGAPAACEDGNPCTADSCAAGKCQYTAQDGAACDDGAACTASSACKGGQCVASSPCLVFLDAFACDQQTAWAVVKPAPDPGQQQRNVAWAVDQTPSVPDQAKYGCTLNFNDGTDHCDQVGFGGNSCQLPKGEATSPLLDFTGVGSLIPAISFDVWYDLDLIQYQYYTWDMPKITVREEGGAVLGEWLLPLTAADVQVWKPAYTIEIPAAKGKKVRVSFSLSLPFGYSTDVGNKGKGLFVDNFAAWGLPPVESACGDGQDNDGDAIVDCADPDCSADLLCKTGPTVTAVGTDCSNNGWDRESSSQSVVWADDQSPASVTPQAGSCTLNFNDGTDYRPGNTNNTVGGTARWTTTISLVGKTKAALQFWAYMDVEPNGACEDGPGCNHSDLLTIEVSSDGFDGCGCDPDESCGDFAPCSDANTRSWVLAKDKLKSWQSYALDLSAFAGKSIQVRFRFDTLDGFYNQYPGVFVDSARVVAE